MWLAAQHQPLPQPLHILHTRTSRTWEREPGTFQQLKTKQCIGQACASTRMLRHTGIYLCAQSRSGFLCHHYKFTAKRTLLMIDRKHNKHSTCHMHTSVLMSREGWGDNTFTRSAESSCGYCSTKTTALMLLCKHERGIHLLVMSDSTIRDKNMPLSRSVFLIWPITTQTK